MEGRYISCAEIAGKRREPKKYQKKKYQKMYEKILSGREAHYQLFTKPVMKKVGRTIAEVLVLLVILGGAVVLLLK